MFRRGQWLVALLLATAAHAGFISHFAPLPPSGSEQAGDQGIALNIQLQPPRSSAPQVRPTPLPAETAKQRAKPLAAAPTSQAVKTVTKSASRNLPKTAPPTSASDKPGKADYYTKLQAWLNAHKHYPTEARHQGWEGVTELEFVVQPDGHVAWSRLARSSGYLMLDDAATRLLDDAQPLPVPPPELDARGRHVRVPISYRLY